MAYNPAAVRKAYDEIAQREEQLEKGFSLRNEIPREFIKKYLKESDTVLDAGGGAGINAILMARICQSVTLVDLSPELLKLANVSVQENGLAHKVYLREGDITELREFPDGQFSFVVCVGGTLSYLLEQGVQAMRELVRVAKMGATIIVGCDSKYGFVRWLLDYQSEADDPLEIAAEILEAGEYEAGEGAFARLYTADELCRLLQEVGCEILETGSTPVLVNGWEQSSYPEDKRQRLKELELQYCTKPELLGTGHLLFCVAKKS